MIYQKAKPKVTRKDILLEAVVAGNLHKTIRILKKCHSRLEISKVCRLIYVAYTNAHFHISSYLLEVNQNDVCSEILEYACEKNDTEFVNYLIPLLPSIDVQLEESEDIDVNRHTPLTIACENNNMELAKILLDAGADVNGRYRKDVDIPLHYAVESNKVELVKMLLDRGADVNILGWCYSNVIESACKNKNIEMVKLLIDHGSDIYFKRWLKRSALHHACSSVHYSNLDPKLDTAIILDFLESLISNFGFDINIRDEWERTPLHYALDNNEIDMAVVEYLISKGADVNAQDNKGETVFYKSDLEMQEYLLKHGADVNIANKDGDTSFLQAAQYCNLEMIEFLIAHGADVNAKNNKGENALHRACLYYFSEIKDIEYLLSLGIDPHAITEDGENVLHYAFAAGMIDIAKYFIDLGVDWKIRDNKGCSILHTYCASYRSTLYGVKYLLSLGFDVNERSDDGRTAFLYGAYDGSTDVMEHLVKMGADINARSNDGRNAFHWSCAFGLGTYRTEYLVYKGVDINVQDNDGQTILHKIAKGYGFSMGHVERIVNYLIDNGADPSIKDNAGNIAFEVEQPSYKPIVLKGVPKQPRE